jgi:hypothetical protein
LDHRIKTLILCVFLFLAALSKSAFAFDLALIEPAELDQDKGRWVILDARPQPGYLAGHIPGSAFIFVGEPYAN